MQEITSEHVKKAAGGDLRAFETIYRQCAGFVYSVALRMTRNTADAEEVTQDAFLKVYRSLNRFENRSSFKTWVYRIAMNSALDFCRRRSAEAGKRVEFESQDHAGASSPEALSSLAREDAKKKLEQFLETLNEDQRACILLREVEGLNYREIADVLDININTVRSRLKRARETMTMYAKRGVIKNEL